MTGDDDGSMLYYGSIGGRKVSWLFVICTSRAKRREEGYYFWREANFVCPSTNTPVS